MSWWNPLDWYSGIDAEIERGKQLDQQIDTYNRRRVEEGKMTPADYQGYLSRNEFAGDNYSQEVSDAFWQGMGETWDRITDPLSEAAQRAANTAKNAITLMVVLQFAVGALALYLAYKYFLVKRG